MKSLVLTIALMLTMGSAFAEVDAQAFKVINDIQNGRDNNNQIKTLRVLGDATVGGALTATGDISVDDLTVTDDALISGDAAVSGTLGVTGTSSLGVTSVRSLTVTSSASVSTNLTVGGAATLNGSLVVAAALVNAPGTNVLSASNAPAVASTSAPLWVKVTVNGTNCIFAAYPIQ